MGNNLAKIGQDVVNSAKDVVNSAKDASKKKSNSNACEITQTKLKVYKITKPFYTINRINCADYSIDTKCSEKTCEVCKNFAYRDWYEQNNAKKIPILGNYDDSKAEYNRTWVQTCNLGIGIVLLSIGIYYQQSE